MHRARRILQRSQLTSARFRDDADFAGRSAMAFDLVANQTGNCSGRIDALEIVEFRDAKTGWSRRRFC
jgi:hypothetical protein